MKLTVSRTPFLLGGRQLWPCFSVMFAALLGPAKLPAAQVSTLLSTRNISSIIPDTRDARLIAILRPVAAVSLQDPLQSLKGVIVKEPSAIMLIHAVAFSATRAEAMNILRHPSVESLWVVEDDMAGHYVRLLRSIDYSVVGAAAPTLNISIAPFTRYFDAKYDSQEPLHRAFKEAFDRGTLAVVAASNKGPALATTNPWCQSPWVVCVGAADEEGKTVALFSGRGRPDRLDTWPTVVGPGVDIVTTHPASVPKSKELQDGEKRVSARRQFPEGFWRDHTAVSGTSFSTPAVANASNQVRYFLRCASAEKEKQFTLQFQWTPEEKKDPRFWTQRLIGKLERQGATATVVYPMEESPLLIKQLLIDMAIPIPGTAPHESGGGFINIDIAAAVLGKYGRVSTKILPVKSE